MMSFNYVVHTHLPLQFHTDIDECKDSDPCHSDADCSNFIGSFSCACKPGYSGDGMECTSKSDHQTS